MANECLRAQFEFEFRFIVCVGDVVMSMGSNQGSTRQ